MAEISCLVCVVAFLIGCYPTLEQPISSTMVKLPSFSSLFSFQQFNFERTLTWMGAFGGKSPKVVQVWHCGIFHGLNRPRPVMANARELATKNGDQFTGIKDALVESGHCTFQFGQNVANLFRAAS